MQSLMLAEPGQALKVLCLGAHSDDIEIRGRRDASRLDPAGSLLDIHWCVLSACDPRHAEAMAGADAILEGAVAGRVECAKFRDGHFAYQGTEIKTWIGDLKARVKPDIVFTHRREDAHQDHSEVCRLTWNAFRDHLVLEYEIPKWDGDFGQPNLYIPMSEAIMERKIELLETCFGTQRSKDWFDADTFRGLAGLRGMECRAPERFAEAFVPRKLRVDCVPSQKPIIPDAATAPGRSSKELLFVEV